MNEITLERVEAAFAKARHSRVDDPNGLEGIVIPFEDFAVFYQVGEQLLSSTARWRAEVPAHLREQVQAFVLEQNSHLIAPTMAFEDAVDSVIFKSDHPLAEGLDYEQLDALLHTQLQLHAAAVGMSNQRFPELVTWHKERA